MCELKDDPSTTADDQVAEFSTRRSEGGEEAVIIEARDLCKTMYEAALARWKEERDDSVRMQLELRMYAASEAAHAMADLVENIQLPVPPR